MAVKSIIDVDINNDEKFRAFAALYEKYQTTLAKAPGTWAAVGKEVQANRKGFEAIAAALLAQNEMARRAATEQRKSLNDVNRSAGLWRDMARSTKTVAGNIKDITLSLLKWSAVTGIVSGLVGAGGLFGIDRLALGVSAGRRSSLGLGTGYGEERAFGANFGRLVDPGSLLTGVSTALAGNRTALFGAGLSGDQLKGTTAQVSVEVLRSVKRMVDRTDESQLGFMAQARRLGELGFGVEDLRRLKRTSPEEFNDLQRRYGQNRGDFDLPPDVARKWQEFTTQMTRAGQGIENTFVRGLAPLAPGLTKLSEGFEKVVRAFLTSPALEKWIKAVDGGLEKFAEYIGTPEFEKTVRDFAVNLGNAAVAVGRFAAWVVGKSPEGATTGGILGEKEDHDTWNDIVRGSRKLRNDRAAGKGTLLQQLGRSFNNPGNLRPAGSSVGFQSFATPEEGVKAMARQLSIYARRDRLDTIDSIVGKYAPPSENNTRAYVGDVSRKTGFRPGQHIDLNDRETMAKLVAAMISHEQRPGRYDMYKDAKVVVSVMNTTGGNAAVTVNGLKN